MTLLSCKEVINFYLLLALKQTELLTLWDYCETAGQNHGSVHQ